jgi:hypothetical protein
MWAPARAPGSAFTAGFFPGLGIEFPVTPGTFPVPPKEFPVLFSREFSEKTSRRQRVFAASDASNGPKIEKFPVFSLLIRESSAERRSHQPASSSEPDSVLGATAHAVGTIILLPFRIVADVVGLIL